MKLRLLDIANSTVFDRTNGSVSTEEANIIPKLSASQREKYPLSALDIEWLAEAALERANFFVGSFFKTRPHSATDEHKYTVTEPSTYPPTTISRIIRARQINNIRNSYIAMRSHPSTWRTGYLHNRYLSEVDWTEKTYNDFIADNVTPQLLTELDADWCKVQSGDRVTLDTFYNSDENSGLYVEAKNMCYPILRFGTGMTYEPASKTVYDDVVTGIGNHLIAGFGGGFGGYKMSKNYDAMAGLDQGQSAVELPTPRTSQTFDERDFAAARKYNGIYKRGNFFGLFGCYVLIDESNYSSGNSRHIEKWYRKLMQISDSSDILLYNESEYSRNTKGIVWNYGGSNLNSAICRRLIGEVASKVGLDITKTAAQVNPSNSFSFNWEIFLYLEDVFAVAELDRNSMWS